jgi:hypothetical protein
MSSKRRTQSSGANGAKSTGPATPAGKLKSALNLNNHRNLEAYVPLACENPANLLLCHQQHHDTFQPTNAVESALVEEMASCYWRMRRAWCTPSLGKHAGSYADIAEPPAVAGDGRLANRYQIMYQRALSTLKLMRSLNPAYEPRPINDQPVPGVPGLKPARTPPPTPPPPSQAIDSESLGSACFRLHGDPAAPAADPAPEATPPNVKRSGGAV